MSAIDSGRYDAAIVIVALLLLVWALTDRKRVS